METESALREAVKYNLIALGPTVVGLVFAFLGLWFGALGPLLETANESGFGAVMAGEAGFTINGAIVAVGVGLGYIIHRIGRTTLLFKLYGETLLAELDKEHVERSDETERVERRDETESVD